MPNYSLCLCLCRPQSLSLSLWRMYTSVCTSAMCGGSCVCMRMRLCACACLSKSRCIQSEDSFWCRCLTMPRIWRPRSRPTPFTRSSDWTHPSHCQSDTEPVRAGQLQTRAFNNYEHDKNKSRLRDCQTRWIEADCDVTILREPTGTDADRQTDRREVKWRVILRSKR